MSTVIPAINEMRRLTQPYFDYVFLCRTWHPLDQNISFASNSRLPDHCVQGSFGAEFHKDLVILGSDFEIRKGVLSGSKEQTNSCFGEDGEDTALTKRLQQLGVKRVYCCGLGLDRGVGTSAEHASMRGFDSYVIKDCTKAVDEYAEHSMI